MFRTVSVVVAAVTLSACGFVKTNVTRFHEFPSDRLDGTFVVVAGNPDKQNDLEFRKYGAEVESELRKYGLNPAAESDRPDYVVLIDYGIGEPRTTVSTSTVYGQTGGGTTHFSGNTYGYGGNTFFSGSAYSPPTYGAVGTSVDSSTVYTRTFVMDIVDLRLSTPDKVTKVFEGKVLSEGSSDSVAAVADCLIKAMFKEFPGASGKPEKYVLSWDRFDKTCKG